MAKAEFAFFNNPTLKRGVIETQTQLGFSPDVYYLNKI